MPNTALSLAICMSQAAITSKPGPEAEAVDPSDDGHRQVAQHFAHAMDQRQEIACSGRVQFAQFMQVRAAHEGAMTLAGDDQYPQVRVVGQSR